MKIRKIRLLSLILALALVFNTTTLTAYAATPAKAMEATGQKSLSGLVLTGLDEPIVGVPFDGTTTITSAEGVTWEIPVIWMDAEGNIVTVPVRGKKYLPTFVFYIPEGYTVKGIGAQGRFAIKLPTFLTSLYGTDDMLFTTDPSTGVTFIVYGISQYSGYAGTGQNSGLFRIQPARAPESESAPQPILESVSEPAPLSEITPEPALQPANEIPEQVRIHCTEKVIQMIDPAFLAEFVDIVKHRLIPQAANLLQESFQAYGNAREGELGREIGLIIYNGDDECYSSVLGGTYDLSDYAFAFNMTIVSNSTGSAFQIIGINSAGCIVQNPDGSFSLVSGETDRIDLGNALMHEMMHAFMQDYTRFGMTSVGGDKFPIWFYEGIAQTVLNTYQSYGTYFQELSDADRRGEYDPDGRIYEGEIVYSAQSLLARLNEGDDAVSDLFDITQEEGYSPYVAGYLAVIYLGYLEAKHGGNEALGNDGSCNINTIRGGVSSILERLHNNETLDGIINSISDYNNTAEFQSRFMNGEEQEEKDMAALNFCASYLNFLEGQKIQDGDGTCFDLANGSILTQDQQYVYILDYDTEAESSLYRVADVGDFVNTGTDLVRPWETGGVSEQGWYELEDEEEEIGTVAALKRPQAPSEEAPVVIDGSGISSAEDTVDNTVEDAIADTAADATEEIVADTVEDIADDTLEDTPDYTAGAEEISEEPEESAESEEMDNEGQGN